MDTNLQLALLTAQIEQLSADVKALTDASLLSRKTWLPPAEFAEMCNISPGTLRDKRRAGEFREESMRRHQHGKRTDYSYHRDFALVDIQGGLD